MIIYRCSYLFVFHLSQVGYVPDFGTVYISGYDRLPFHVNKTDEYGNTMLSLACQNGNMKLCKYLIGKGANPNHQNKNGQTPAHFAIAYKFFDLSTYLFENGGDDTIENRFGLSPYDGLSAEGEGGGDFPMLEN
jgi:ankyrin repeat protein